MSLILYISNRKEWRKWLKEHHNTVREVWLIYYKKHTGKPRIPYDDAVEEALCLAGLTALLKGLMMKSTAKNSPREILKASGQSIIKNGLQK